MVSKLIEGKRGTRSAFDRIATVGLFQMIEPQKEPKIRNPKQEKGIMKKIAKAVILAALVAIARSTNAQIDISGLELVPPDQVPATGTFWSATHDWPPVPVPDDPSLPIYA